MLTFPAGCAYDLFSRINPNPGPSCRLGCSNRQFAFGGKGLQLRETRNRKIAETQGRNNLLEIQLEEANRLVKLTQTKENCMQEECSLLHGMIAELQVTIQKQYDVRVEIKEAELKEIIDKKESEIQLLNKQLCSQEREKQNEIIKLQMEFNTKLVKIQSTSIKSPHQDSSALPQNIFKRKLQHLQEEKNREIAALRRTIRELEQQQDCSQSSYVKRRRF
ncbi:hypothetical protein chiPu_0013467 [Chiloscyllium punctatum]|uniref:Coiled-coil domain-containing protein 152 n=1 Tax=Chiloscyllium punctatum TaxID=137246 RepID=A0A401SX59_CHIPU|nr:hypothetical protein [Chiloscyllium punctatum]